MNKLPYPTHHRENSQHNNGHDTRYERNRKLLARVFMVWSVILLGLLLNVLGVL